jgi:glycine C-acetyltransferase/8-amino-7-oxononanoate synthase
VCGDEEMVRYLLNTSRSFIFSTAAPPPAMAGALAALDLLQERPHRVQRLGANARTLRRSLASEGFAVADGDMHIVPLIVGDERDTLRLCQAAIERGVFAQAIRPPTVPAGTSRLRLAAMASHTASDLRMAAEVLAAAARELGLDPAQLGTPLDEPELGEQPEQGLEHETPEPLPAARSTPSAPFDIEQPRPRRPPPPAPAQADIGDAKAPFDGERESAVAHAA